MKDEEQTPDAPDAPLDNPVDTIARRDVVAGAAALPVAVAAAPAAASDPARERPQVGDVFVFTKGERKHEVITPDDLPLGGQPIIAFPKDPTSGVVRTGSRLNRVTLIRVDPTRITERMQPHAAEGGIVAYSAICTHGGCLVEMWREKDEALFCPCHYSRYDAWDMGAIKGGPAPRRLANLPVALVDGNITVAGKFNGRVGNR